MKPRIAYQITWMIGRPWGWQWVLVYKDTQLGHHVSFFDSWQDALDRLKSLYERGVVKR